MEIFLILQPLRLNNVDENMAREVDEVLIKESDKQEILRKVSFYLLIEKWFTNTVISPNFGQKAQDQNLCKFSNIAFYSTYDLANGS